MFSSFYGYIVDTKNSNKKITGVRLEISESNVIIEIPGQSKSMKFDILFGYFSNYGNVTIIGASFYSSAGFFDEDGVTKYKVKHLVKGIRFNELEEIRFSRAYIEIPSLSDFYANTLLKHSHIGNSYSITVDEPIEIKLADIDNLSLLLSIGNQIQWKDKSVKINETFKLKITSTEEDITLTDFFNIVSRFQDFLLLILNYSPNIKSITFYKNDYYFMNGDKKSQIPIELITNFHNIEYDKIFNYNQIKYSSVNDVLGNMLYLWYKNIDLHVSIDLLTEKAHNRELSSESYFLNSCFAIEIFHRRMYDGTEYPKATFNEIMKTIHDSIENKSVNTFIKSKLQYANELSFRKRLKSFKEDFLKILPESVEVTHFISKIVNTRNYLVHRSNNNDIFKGIELFYASKYIESVLRIYFLKKINCPTNIIIESYSYAKNNLYELYNLNKQL